MKFKVIYITKQFVTDQKYNEVNSYDEFKEVLNTKEDLF